MQRHQAPFRADIVGSFLRPNAIKQRACSWRKAILMPAICVKLRMKPSANWFSSSAIAACTW